MSALTDEGLAKAAHRMEDAAEAAQRAASSIEQNVHRLCLALEDGYGGNGPKLIELLEKLRDEPAVPVRQTDILSNLTSEELTSLVWLLERYRGNSTELALVLGKLKPMIKPVLKSVSVRQPPTGDMS